MIKLIISDNEINTELPFFATEKYLKSMSSSYGWFASRNFILPFLLHKTMIFKRLVFTTNLIKINDCSIEEEKIFFNNLIVFIKKNNICDFIHKPHPSVIFNTYPDNIDVYKWGSYILNIDNNLERMISNLSKSQRNYVRRSIKDKVKIVSSSDINKIYPCINNTLKRQKIPLLIDKEELKNQFKLFHPNNMIMFKAIYKNEIQGTLVIFIDNKNAYAEYAGSILKPKNGSLKLLHLTAIKYLADNFNLETYDFIGAIPDIKEGSKEAGIQKFKKEFNATLKEGYQFSLIINPFKFFLFDLCLKLSFFMKGIKYTDPVKRYKRLSKSNLKV
jgi:hypothetical protein